MVARTSGNNAIDDMNYDTAVDYFKKDRLRELSSTRNGLRFLKLRALSRKAQMEHLINKHAIDVGGASSREWLKIIYESGISMDVIDKEMLDLYEQERVPRRENEEKINQ